MELAIPTSPDGVIEQLFTVPGPNGEVPGVLWTPAAGHRPSRLILMGHGGGQHKKAPGIVSRARQLVIDGGFAVVAVDAPGHGDRPRTEEQARLVGELRNRMQAGGDVAGVLDEFHALLAGQSVPEWRAVVDAIQELDDVDAAPLGYWGMSLGCALGLPFVAADRRVAAAVLGLNGAETSASAAARITAPVEFLVQWDDEQVPRSAALAVFDAFASEEKTLHANPGGHHQVPSFEMDSSLRFFTRHLR